jgi:divalent metal cation (Fe/Co/Zn/Cd) transporter
VFDPVVALLLAAYMAYAAIGLVRTALDEILDSALPERDVEAIKAVLQSHAGDVSGYHNLRTRRSGANRQVDMHLLFSPQRTVTEVHDITDRIAEDIEARLPGCVVVVHPEPDTGDTDTADRLALGPGPLE